MPENKRKILNLNSFSDHIHTKNPASRLILEQLRLWFHSGLEQSLGCCSPTDPSVKWARKCSLALRASGMTQVASSQLSSLPPEQGDLLGPACREQPSPMYCFELFLSTIQENAMLWIPSVTVPESTLTAEQLC